MLYTKKGDNGTTKTFGCDQRISKSSTIAEALGSLDEINSFLGMIKVMEGENKGKNGFDQLIHMIQETLFIVQAQIAGAPKTVPEERVKDLENIIDDLEKKMPPIKTFFISGGTNLASHYDFGRTIARRAERRVVAVSEEGKVKVQDSTLAFLNRLSSVLYALARFSNHDAGIKENSPQYR